MDSYRLSGAVYYDCCYVELLVCSIRDGTMVMPIQISHFGQILIAQVPIDNKKIMGRT